jgi:hypothetical protein
MLDVRWWPRQVLMLVCAAAAMAMSSPAAAQADRPQCTVELADTLEGWNCAFLKAGARRIEFLPGHGIFTYYLTSHTPARNVRGAWRFAATDVAEAAAAGGPLHGVFAIRYEGQPVGRLAHQILHRGTRWRRVRGNRFVPPGAAASSPAFVEWRREGDRWVVSAIGDEAFAPGVSLPQWCC